MARQRRPTSKYQCSFSHRPHLVRPLWSGSFSVTCQCTSPRPRALVNASCHSFPTTVQSPHASVDGSWRSSWAGHSDTPTFTKCIQVGLLVSFLTCYHRPPCSTPTCLLDIAWLGNLAGQGAVLDAGVHAARIGVTRSHLPLFLPCTVTHVMISLVIMAGRLGAKTFFLPLAGIACLIAWERVF